MDAIVATSTTPDELPIAQARDDIVFLAERNQELESAMAFGAAPLVRL